MPPLDTIADRQAQWSVSANHLKGIVDKARWAVFLLSVAGALLAALASQLGGSTLGGGALASDPRAWVAIAAAVSLAFATFFTQRLLGTEHVTAWVRARAISEALKREAYKYAAGGQPYQDPDPAKNTAALEQERIRIENDGTDLLGKLIAATGPGSTPRAPLSKDEYLAQRVNGQIAWYNRRASEYRSAATWLRRVEFCLAVTATALTAIASVAGKSPLFGVPFDIAALTAVLTTVAGAVLAHVEAQRYDFLVMTYLATARRLEDRRNGSQDPWPTFVRECEDILKEENTSWIAKWTK